MSEQIITDDQIEKAFLNTNFGDMDRRVMLTQGILKTIAGYKTGGHTLTNIMKNLGLISDKGTVLKKGKMLLFKAFYKSELAG